MTGSVNGADFEASGSIGGMVTGTYAISGSFTTADDWNGTFTITFIGDTGLTDCTNRQFPIQGERVPLLFRACSMAQYLRGWVRLRRYLMTFGKAGS